MNNKGFIATSIIYSFFIVFSLMCLSILATYTHYRRLNVNLNNNIKDELKDIVINKSGGESFDSDSDFDYTGSIQTFTAPVTGTYKLEVWGAQGGNSLNNYNGGYGGYSQGNIILDKNDIIYICVGGAGSAPTVETCNHPGGYNGGGKSSSCEGYGINKSRAASGGGATHIALDSGILSNLSSHATDGRILIVAGGGGGADYSNYTSDNYYYSYGGHGGGYIGSSSSGSSYYYGTNHTVVTGGRQSANNPANQGENGYAANLGLFGQGANGTRLTEAGGGGGYYGGNSGKNFAAGGGSGYIGSSLLISSEGLIKHMSCYDCATSSVESTKTESNTCHSVEPTEDCAKEGNGYARITFLE